MAWSNVTLLWDRGKAPGQDDLSVPPVALVASTDTDITSESITTARIVDETGIIQAVFAKATLPLAKKNPGTTAGTFIAQGRLSQDAPFSDIYVNGSRVEVDAADVATGVTFFTSVAMTEVPILPEMRCRGEDINVANSNTYVSIYICE